MIKADCGNEFTSPLGAQQGALLHLDGLEEPERRRKNLMRLGVDNNMPIHGAEHGWQDGQWHKAR